MEIIRTPSKDHQKVRAYIDRTEVDLEPAVHRKPTGGKDIARLARDSVQGLVESVPGLV